jgi:hypothetical protein
MARHQGHKGFTLSMARTRPRKYRTWLQAILLLVVVAFVIGKVTGMLGTRRFTCDFPDRVSVDDLVYVEHARCRMACRDISEALVAEVYLKGELNCRKSTVANGHPRYALERRDHRGDLIRIIVELDGGEHVIVTAIRLDQPDHCTCS